MTSVSVQIGNYTVTITRDRRGENQVHFSTNPSSSPAFDIYNIKETFIEGIRCIVGGKDGDSSNGTFHSWRQCDPLKGGCGHTFRVVASIHSIRKGEEIVPNSITINCQNPKCKKVLLGKEIRVVKGNDWIGDDMIDESANICYTAIITQTPSGSGSGVYIDDEIIWFEGYFSAKYNRNGTRSSTVSLHYSKTGHVDRDEFERSKSRFRAQENQNE